jgi:hypothetical protein
VSEILRIRGSAWATKSVSYGSVTKFGITSSVKNPSGAYTSRLFFLPACWPSKRRSQLVMAESPNSDRIAFA